jgi:hypothetical protein
MGNPFCCDLCRAIKATKQGHRFEATVGFHHFSLAAAMPLSENRLTQPQMAA